MSGTFNKAEILNQIQFLPQAEPFRSRVTYSNLMYLVLGEVIEKRTGVSWDGFVTTRLFEPLGMTATTTDRTTVPAERLAIRHRLYDGQVAVLRTPDADRMHPAGAMYSTITDMARWLIVQLGEGEFNGNRLITASAIREMQSLQQSIPVKWRPDSDEYDARFAGTGLGWYLRDYRGRKVVQHGGAWGAEMAFLPEEKLGVVVLSNRDLNGLVWMLIYDVFDAFLVGPEQAWKQGAKWERWLKIGGPGTMGRDRDQQRAELEKSRQAGTRPSLPLASYAGVYASRLYGNLTLTLVDDRLHVQFGDYAAGLEHWEQDAFYGRAVIEPYFDWLVKFDFAQTTGMVRGLEIVHVGWKDSDERFLFQRSSAR
jgi:CubicO group peptidase (beta-lactamase class C family)